MTDTEIRAQIFVDRKYTSTADARQAEMGLRYVTAERQDLAREMARFAEAEAARWMARVIKLEAKIAEIRKVIA